MFNSFACMPSVNWLPCEWQPWSINWILLPTVLLIAIVLIAAALAYSKGVKEHNKKKEKKK